MSYVYPLTQLEVRFTNILNFNQVIREILSPYLRMTTSFNFINVGGIEQGIKINFEEDLYSIDCRWDRLIFLCEDNPERFTKVNSVFKIFLEIWKKLTEVPTFGASTNYLYLEYEINILEIPQPEVIKKFTKKFLTDEINKIMKSPEELAIVLEEKKGTKQINVNFGPYSSKDIKRHQLFPFTQRKETDQDNETGTLFRFQLFDKPTEINYTLLKNVLEEQKKYSSNFKI